jgi:hypothetical protein
MNWTVHYQLAKFRGVAGSRTVSSGKSRLRLLAIALLLAACGREPTAAPLLQPAPDPALQGQVSKLIMAMDSSAATTCSDRKVVRTAAIDIRPDGHAGTERWTIDRCGTTIAYRVTYTPDGKGGNTFTVQPE